MNMVAATQAIDAVPIVQIAVAGSLYALLMLGLLVGMAFCVTAIRGA